MKQEEKNTLSRLRITEAAMKEFSRNGYEAASLNAMCADNGLSKGIVYHYYKDKDELYLSCVENCFNAVTEYLSNTITGLTGSAEQHLRCYFDARLRFFAENNTYLGIFASAVFFSPASLVPRIATIRKKFDDLNISVLTELIKGEKLRNGMSVETVVKDFSMYMDYFNLHFKSEMNELQSTGELLKEHEERCHRQLRILLYGILVREDEN